MSDEEKKKKKLLKVIPPVIIGVISLIFLHGFFRWVVVILAESEIVLCSALILMLRLMHVKPLKSIAKKQVFIIYTNQIMCTYIILK